MNVKAVKLEIIQWILDENNTVVFDELKLFKKSHTETNPLSIEEKELIKKGRQDILAGNFDTHENVINRIKSKRPVK